MNEYFTTTVSFTENEFAALMASLELASKGAKKYLKDNGEDSLTSADKESIKQIEDLFDRLKEDFVD